MSFELEGEIRRLEYLAQSRPGAHRRRVALWSALGYGLLGLFPLSLLGLGATVLLTAQRQGCLCLQNASATLTLAFFAILGALGLSLSSFLVRLAPPVGIPLRRADAPALFSTIESVAQRVGVRSPTRVLLTPDGGAGVAELPQAWGGTRSYLLLGLPLLESLPCDQLDAVLAHELAHLRGGDSRVTRAATRLAAIWERLAGQIATQGAGRLLTRLSQWYFPRLAAHTLAVRRENERAADRLAASTASPTALAEALCAAQIRLRFLEDAFQAALKERARSLPNPPERLFRAYVETLRTPLTEDDARDAVFAALGERLRWDEAHPPLAERLSALGHAPTVPPPPEISAAQTLLQPGRERFLDILDALWRKQATPEWRRRFWRPAPSSGNGSPWKSGSGFWTARVGCATHFCRALRRRALRGSLPGEAEVRPNRRGARVPRARKNLAAAGDASGVALVESALLRVPEQRRRASHSSTTSTAAGATAALHATPGNVWKRWKLQGLRGRADNEKTMSRLPPLKELVLSSGLFVPAYALYRLTNRAERERHTRERAFYGSLLAPDSLVFDVGANIGKKTEVFLECGARAIAFEPQAHCVRELEARCAPWKSRLSVEQAAVGEEVGEAILHLRNESSEQASLLADWEGTTLAEVRVPVTTLDAAIEKHGVPDFCKIDVEGFELHVLKGLSQPIPLLSLEYHLRPREIETVRACLERLAEFGMLSLNVLPASESAWTFPEWLSLDAFQDVFPQKLSGEYGDLFVRTQAH